MGYYVQNTKRNLIILIIIFGSIFLYFFAPVYKCKNVDKKSEWYVNDIYMSNQYYYENLLNDEEKQVYKEMFIALNNIEEKFYIDHPYHGYVDKVWDALICDHPEMINITTFRYYNVGNGIEIQPTYLTTSEFDLRNKERKVQKKISKVKSATNGKSLYEKEKYIYEVLGNSSGYGHTFRNSDQSAYTAFSATSNTVCAGYGKAAQILLSNCGINSWINVNEEHIWNTVELEGEYYYFDATVTGMHVNVEGSLDNVSYCGLNQNKNTSSYRLLYKTPGEITGEKYNYYDYENLTLTYSEENLEQIKEIIDSSKFNIVELKFTNFSEALNGLYENKYYLGIDEVTYYVGYCKNNGVVILTKTH